MVQGCAGAGAVMWGGEQQEVTRGSAGGGRARGGDDDDLMIFTEINAAIVQERLKISQQILRGLTRYKTLRHIVLKQQGVTWALGLFSILMMAFSAWERVALLKCMHKREHWTQWSRKNHVLTGFTQVHTEKHVKDRPWLNIWVRLPNHKARNVGQLQGAKQKEQLYFS